MNKLLNKAEIFYQNSLFYLYKNATLRKDMLRRIMHSILPSISDKQVNSPYETVDYRSLVLAADGRKDIIFYGTKACVDEVDHYYDIMLPKKSKLARDLIRSGQSNFDLGKFEDAIKLCKTAFSDQNPDAWDIGYGGGPWYKIADTIFELIKLDNELNRLVKERASDTEKILILNEIITYLNIFDGLSHNNASIFEKLIKIENRFAPKSKNNDRHLDSDIYEYMNTKELKNPIDTFKALEQLSTSSDIPLFHEQQDVNIYLEYINKLKKDPSYLDNSDMLQYDMAVVPYRKGATKFISEFYSMIDEFNLDDLSSCFEDIHNQLNIMADIFIPPSGRLNYLTKFNNYFNNKTHESEVIFSKLMEDYRANTRVLRNLERDISYLPITYITDLSPSSIEAQKQAKDLKTKYILTFSSLFKKWLSEFQEFVNNL